MTGTEQLLMIAVTIIAGFCGWCLAYLNRKIDTMMASFDPTIDRKLTEMKTQLVQLKVEIDRDREQTNNNRVLIAQSMVTKSELNDQTRRLLDELDRRLPPYRRATDHHE